MIASPAWLTDIQASWRPRERLGGAAWADAERVLSIEESPQPGPWRSKPWQRELLDAFADPDLDWIVILKAAQMGVSELVRCAVGRWALLDPGDVLWVVTTEDAARKAMKKLQAMFRSTPSLRALVSPRKRDSTLLELRLTNGMRVVIGWAGSPQSLASDPFRYVVLDEVAKHRWSVQGEPSSVELGRERVKTYGRRGKVILLSSPKHDNDLICASHREVRDRRVFAIPCPSCGLMQPCEWDSVRWPGGEPSKAPAAPSDRTALADQVEAEESAWLECRGCKGKIVSHRAAWDPRAAWVSEDSTEEAQGGRRRAYHVTEFFHWETTLSDLVVKFLRAVTPSAIQGFFNGSLGSPRRSDGRTIRADIFRVRAVHPARTVPSWATTVIATGDTQLGGWHYMVRAWGHGSRSRLLDWGWASSGEELEAKTLEARFVVEGSTILAKPLLLAIDSGGGMAHQDGSRTMDTYDFVRAHRRAFALRGDPDHESLQGKPSRQTEIEFRGRPFKLWLVNKNFWADELCTLVLSEEPVLWEECRGAENPAYGRQMASEEKVLVQGERGSKELWQKRATHAENHAWDLARYQVWAASELAHVELRISPTWIVADEPVQEVSPVGERPKETWKIGRR